MKRFLCLSIASLFAYSSHAQVTITVADMPVPGDTLVYSNVTPATVTINPGDSGANINWNYELIATTQGMDVYRSTAQISPILGFQLTGDLFGYKTLDSIPFIGAVLPVSLADIYTFFQKITVPSCYVAGAISASVSGIPLASSYTEPDVWYKFPLTYGNVDSNFYAVNINIPTVGSIIETGYRKNTVDGWGTISTPYYTTPVNCIRVRSEIFETDAVTFNGTTIPIPRNSVEYKWLVPGEHYPALWVISNLLPGGGETISSVKYRDRMPEISAVQNTSDNALKVSGYPNPCPNGIFTISLPAGVKTFHADVYDIQSRLVVSQDNDPVINIKALPAGNYVVRVLCRGNAAFMPIVK